MKVIIFHYFVYCPPLASQLPKKMQHVYIPSLSDLISCRFPVHPNISLMSVSILFSWTFQACSQNISTIILSALMTLPQTFPWSLPHVLQISAVMPLIREAFPGHPLLKFSNFKLPSLPLLFSFRALMYLFVHCLSPPTGLLHNKNKGFVVYLPLFTGNWMLLHSTCSINIHWINEWIN